MEPSVIDLLRCRQVKKIRKKEGTVLIDKGQDVKLQIKGNITEEAQWDQPTLEVGKQQDKQKEILKQKDLENTEKNNNSQ